MSQAKGVGIGLQRYEPPGPVGAAYIESRRPISVIMGPGGSGKTVGSAYKVVHIASTWLPMCRDGVIRAKTVALRTTYRDMARTALESRPSSAAVEGRWAHASANHAADR